MFLDLKNPLWKKRMVILSYMVFSFQWAELSLNKKNVQGYQSGTWQILKVPILIFQMIPKKL